MKRVLPWLWVWVLGVSACGWPSVRAKLHPNKGEAAQDLTAMPPQLKARGGDSAEGTAVTPGRNKPDATAGLAFTPMEDIVFTNPDNPDAQLPELAEMLAAPKSKTWEESETVARRRSAREGKPLLIWFTSSQNSPLCKALNEELLSTADFEKWATEKLVRLRVDDAASVKDPDLSLDAARTREIEVRDYAAALKKRYKVLGHPTLILLNCSGEVIGRYVGFKRGSADFTWGLVKHGESVSTKAYTSWRADLEKKGYREWQDRRGRKVFARLVSYAKGELVLIEPDGTRSRTLEEKLSDADRAWIAEQKKIRNLP
ncbi:MAG: thioredoxin family protein [Verrucomicrobiota bacterium]